MPRRPSSAAYAQEEVGMVGGSGMKARHRHPMSFLPEGGIEDMFRGLRQEGM